MIFVTVGNMDPFDRLIRTVDAWAADRDPDEIFVQIGTGRYRPQHCRYVDFLTPLQFRETFAQAEFVVSHAGMGTIITALELAKPLVVMPKRAALGEQRNEHQLATVRRFRRSTHIRVADNEEELHQVLAALASAGPSHHDGATRDDEWKPDQSLIDFVRDFIWHGDDSRSLEPQALSGAVR